VQTIRRETTPFLLAQQFRQLHAATHENSAVHARAFATGRQLGTGRLMSKPRFSDQREARSRRDPAVSRRRALLAIPALGVLVLILLWTVIFARLSVEKEATNREAMASAAILSAALEQHTIKAIHQVDQITRFVKYEFEKTPGRFDLASTVEKGVVQSETLVQVSLIDEHGQLIANTAELNPKRIDLSDREHFKVHEHENDDQLYISKPLDLADDAASESSGRLVRGRRGRVGRPELFHERLLQQRGNRP
jgi:hypothetical protein